jgi:hypothetical protein
VHGGLTASQEKDAARKSEAVKREKALKRGGRSGERGSVRREGVGQERGG